MPEVDLQVTISRPLFDVFKKAVDFDALTTWQPHVSLVKVTEGTPLRSGSMLYMEKKFGMGQIFVNADVIDLQRNKLIELKGVHGRFRFHRMTEFSSSGAGQTLIRDRFTLQTGWIFFWYNGWLRSTLESQLKAEWDMLKRALNA